MGPGSAGTAAAWVSCPAGVGGGADIAAVAAVIDRSGGTRCRIDGCVGRRGDRLLPHLHLSVQHGDDLILKRMKRRHLARDVERFCAEARRRRPDVVFGADVIAGFPTETETAHTASLDLLTSANITHLHVFPLFTPSRHTGGGDAAA